MMLRRLVLSLVFVCLLPLLAFADGQRVILVMDASGSMRGKINGQTKMAIAKEVVAKVVGAWKPEDELGLVVYGHRDKNSCDDIETVIEPGQLDQAGHRDGNQKKDHQAKSQAKAGANSQLVERHD